MFAKLKVLPLVVRQGLIGRDEAGATAVEYALMAGFIAGVIVTGVGALGATVFRMFSTGAALFP